MDEESLDAELHVKAGEDGVEIKDICEETYPELKNENDVCLNAVDNIYIKTESEMDIKDECQFSEESENFECKTNKCYSDVKMTDEEDVCISQTNNTYIKSEDDADIRDKCTITEETENLDEINFNDFDIEVKHENNTCLNNESTVFIKPEDIKDDCSFYEETESFDDGSTEQHGCIYVDRKETTTKDFEDSRKIQCTNSNLTMQIKTHTAVTDRIGYSNEKPCKCEICTKKLSQESILRKHIKQHFNEKLFSSEVWSKKSARKDTLVNQMQRQINEKSHTCEVCRKKFSTRNSLVTHRRVHTKEKSIAIPPAPRHGPPVRAQQHRVMDRRQQLRVLYLLYLRKKKRQCRIHWIHPTNEQRDTLGAFATLYKELRSDHVKFFGYFCMSMNTFDALLQCLHLHLQHENTKMRDAIPPVERLAVTIRYLASGHTFTDLHYAFRMGISTISGIVNSVCQTIWAVLLEKCIPRPSIKKLEGIAEGFEKKAYFPHCIGAVDGKQIRTTKSQGSGSVHSNYKDCFSVLLMAVADSDYRFTFVDVGGYGNACDTSIFKNTSFWKSIDENELPLPEPKPLPGSDHPCVPYVIVGDEAFGLHSNLMRPFGGKQLSIAKRVFNYRLNKARLYVEHAFAILNNKWKILHRPLNVSPELAVNIVKACCILHNFVQERERYNFEDTVTVIRLDDVPRSLSVRSGTPANFIRNAFTDYFMSKTGTLSWQFSKI